MKNCLNNVLGVFLALFIIAGCGYLPASKQARKVVGEKLFVEVDVSLQDPENAVSGRAGDGL